MRTELIAEEPGWRSASSGAGRPAGGGGARARGTAPGRRRPGTGRGGGSRGGCGSRAGGGHARDRLAMARLRAEIERLSATLTQCRAAGSSRSGRRRHGRATPPRRSAWRRRGAPPGVPDGSGTRGDGSHAPRLPPQPIGRRGQGARSSTRPSHSGSPSPLSWSWKATAGCDLGGEDLNERQGALKVAEAACADALAAMGVASLAEAEAALERRRGPRTTCGAARPRSRPCSRRTPPARSRRWRSYSPTGMPSSRRSTIAWTRWRIRPTRRRSRCRRQDARPNWSVRSRRWRRPVWA